jgi:hypothetical protein
MRRSQNARERVEEYVVGMDGAASRTCGKSRFNVAGGKGRDVWMDCVGNR